MNAQMKELCEEYLKADHSNRDSEQNYEWDWVNDETANNLFIFLFERNLFKGDYHPLIKEIRAKRIESLTLQETEIYLTGAAAADRVWGAYSNLYADRTLDKLVEHWLRAAKREYRKQAE